MGISATCGDGAQTDIFDLPQATVGAPIGTGVISFDTAAEIHVQTTGDPTGMDGILNLFNTPAYVQRSYWLADDSTGGSSFLQEDYNIHYEGPTGPGIGNSGYSEATISTGSGFSVKFPTFATLEVGNTPVNVLRDSRARSTTA